MQNTIDLYINAIELLHPDDLIFVLDTDFKLSYMSKKCMQALKIDNISLLNNLILQNLPRLQDKPETLQILNQLNNFSKECTINEFLISDPDLFIDFKMFNLTIRKLFNSSQDTLLAYAYFISPIGLEERVKLLYDMLGVTKVDASLSQKLKSIGLTDREGEILFLLCLRFSGREIAEIISNKLSVSVTASTIGNIIRQQLFRKFEVYNIDDLIRKAVALGYWHMPDNYCTHKLINLSKQ